MKNQTNKFEIGDIVKIKGSAVKILEIYRGKYSIVIQYKVGIYDYKILPLFKDCNTTGIPVYSHEIKKYEKAH